MNQKSLLNQKQNSTTDPIIHAPADHIHNSHPTPCFEITRTPLYTVTFKHGNHITSKYGT